MQAALFTVVPRSSVAYGPMPPPSLSLDKDSKCHELRTFTAEFGKLAPLYACFHNHAMADFKCHGVNMVGFWGPEDRNTGAGNTLTDLLAFPTCEANDKVWAAVRKHPDCLKARDKSEKDGKLTARVESVIMGSTSYGPVRWLRR